MIALCVRCFFAQVDAHWQTHFTQFSQHPQTRHTEHRVPPPIHSPPPPPPSGHPAHSSGAPHPLTEAQASPPLRTHFRLSAHTPALRVHPSTASCTCTHNITQPLRARTSTHTLILTFFSSISFFHPVKRQLQARRPRQRQEGSSREGVATASCWEHIWLLEEMRAGEAACSPASHGNSTPHGSQKVIGTPPFLSLLLH